MSAVKKSLEFASQIPAFKLVIDQIKNPQLSLERIKGQTYQPFATEFEAIKAKDEEE